MFEKENFEKKTLWVVIITAITMLIEIFYGISTKSMALFADGIHMGSHVLAIGLSWLAYYAIRKLAKNKQFTGNTNKILSLSGFSSGLMLLIFAIFILFEASKRFFIPEEINYSEAILVAIIGLMVNIASAFLLHHDSEHSDHNIRAAYLHVIADTLTSISAIIGLICAKTWGVSYVDSIAAFISSAVIIKWSVGLLKEAGKELIDLK